MHEVHSDMFHICKSNIDKIKLEIFKFIKIALIIYFFLRMCLTLIEYFIFYKSIETDSLPDIEESIYYKLHSQKFYLQIGFPENSPLYGNIIIYQSQLRLENNEIWVSNLEAQTQQTEQELTPLIILSPPFIHVPPHGPGSGA